MHIYTDNSFMLLTGVSCYHIRVHMHGCASAPPQCMGRRPGKLSAVQKNHEFVRRGNNAQHGQIHVNKAASTFLSANVAALPAYHAETTRLVCTLQVHSHRNSSPACWSVAELGRCLTCPMAAGCAGEIVEEIDASSTSPCTSDCKTTQSYANACQSFKTMDNA